MLNSSSLYTPATLDFEMEHRGKYTLVDIHVYIYIYIIYIYIIYIYTHTHTHVYSLTVQRKLMGSSAQIGSGVCRCGWQAQVPEGSGRFRKVLEGSGAGPAVGDTTEAYFFCVKVTLTSKAFGYFGSFSFRQPMAGNSRAIARAWV